ncbi:hypothetical protein PVAP13_1NG067900 [Panicum virgatum]|uniref:Succinate-semialdehyde dehydrogenase, mitochondrial n=1 Tax=Panicum virgatum TaxID=38727 RepID=A0A8T0WGZ2_PANVG|nr:hypothetical protein PVAP13_1NG067900 [Panicum virgatum]
MAMTMRRAAALGARHILTASSSRVVPLRHMSADAGSAMEKIRAAGLLRTQGLIAGQWVDAYDGKTIEVQNPATGDVLANVSCMGSRETSDAIASANSTFYSWSKLTANERSKALRKWYDLIIAHKEELALLMTLEQGKPLKEALGEVNYGANFIEYFAEEAKRIYGDIIPPTLSDRRLLVLKQVRMITFTGSTAVGKKLMAGSANTVKKVSLELGGNAPCIVFDDADIDVAVKGSLAAKFRNSGQTCVCANRILVQEGIYEKFASAFIKAVQSLHVGNGLEESTSQGPLINEAAVQKVEKFINDATSKGANIMLGGKRHSLGMSFYEPTVVGNVSNDMLLFREEVFGPVAPLIPFKTEEEAIHLANDTNAGLAAYIFTKSIPRSWCVSESLEYGLVGVNEGIISTEVAPFGGVKQSGLGREGSKYGVDEFLELKYICMGNMS